MKLSGNTILITGGGTGIGKGLAKKFKSLGNDVIICGRREDRLKEVSVECPGVHYVKCNIASEQERRDMFEHIRNSFPNLNVIINNGAVQNDYDLTAGPEAIDYAAKEIEINLTAPIMLTSQYIPLLLKQKEPVIINITSILGFTPVARIPIYCAAKAGFHVYTLVLRKQLENTPIQVFEVPPPRVETELNPEGRRKARAAGTDVPGSLMPDEYADFVTAELAKGNLDIFYGPAGDMVRTMPRPVSETARLRSKQV